MATKKTIHIQKRIPSALEQRQAAQGNWERSRLSAPWVRPPPAVKAARIRATESERYQHQQHEYNEERRGQIYEEAKEKIAWKAQFDAANFEMQYTQKQKMDISKGRMLMGAIDQYPDWDDREKESAKEAVFNKYILGTTPSELPRTDKWNKEAGEGVGRVWDSGGVMVSGKANGETWQVDTRKTAAGQAQAAKLKLDEMQIKRQNEREATLFDLRAKLMTTPVDDGSGLKRLLTPREIEERMKSLRGPDEQQPSASRQRESSAKIERARQIVDRVNKKYGSVDEIPERLRGQFFSAMDLLRGEEQGGGGAETPSDAAGRARVAQMRKDAGMPGYVAEGGTPSGVVTVETNADYVNLAPGAEFIDPEGERRRKPK